MRTGWYRQVQVKSLDSHLVRTLLAARAGLVAMHRDVANQIRGIWMGKDFASIAGPLAELLLIGAWINGMAWIPAVLLLGQGRPDVVAKFHAMEIIPFIMIPDIPDEVPNR